MVIDIDFAMLEEKPEGGAYQISIIILVRYSPVMGDESSLLALLVRTVFTDATCVLQ